MKTEEITMTNVTEVKALLKEFHELWTNMATTHSEAYSYKLSDTAKKLVAMNLSQEFQQQYLSESERTLLNGNVVVIALLR